MIDKTVCFWPWVGIVIDPQGFLKPCCFMNEGTLLRSEHYDKDDHHISRVESLDDFSFSDFNTHIKHKLRLRGIYGAPECNTCVKAVQQKVTSHNEHSLRFENIANGTIRYLEVTASNTCNQTCITCNSYFSSKWAEIEHLFANSNEDWITQKSQYNLSDDDIAKIVKIFPQLHELVIKGGEPFADLRNAKMLDHLFDVNPTCRVHITSNVSRISKRFLDILKRAKNPSQIELHGSLDHIGRKYEWIRGTSFDTTLETIKRIYEETGVITQVSPTISYFNVMDMHDIEAFYREYEYTNWFKKGTSHLNWLHWPANMNLLYTRTQEELDRAYIDGAIDKRIESQFNETQYGLLLQNINIMNGIRGFNWQDIE